MQSETVRGNDVKDPRSRDHWDEVYRQKTAVQTSWHQPDPVLSLALIEHAGLDQGASIIDVGGGASLLVDKLFQLGFRQLSVLDISGLALEKARARLPADASVHWITADIREFSPATRYDLWHDRALFHFLTDASDRQWYLAALRAGLVSGGHFIVAAFALDGPPRCSGLEVVRYDTSTLGLELGTEFQLQEEMTETHVTPWGAKQQFVYFRYIYRPAAKSQ